VSRNSREDWARFDAGAIPTKGDLSLLESWLDSLPRSGAPARLLDLGCGVGVVSRRIGGRGFTVVGVDINGEAIEEARHGGEGAFYRKDIASPAGLALEEAPFDIVVCQLVLSVVGTLGDRRGLLTNAREALAPGGHFYLSASGVSSAINPGYARLYAQDFERTGELHTYESRDADGEVLYRTHHFTEAELRALLDDAGFAEIAVVSKTETSSRRPGEAAVFLYAFARKPL
jgi:SAM-dependent methyltransferase